MELITKLLEIIPNAFKLPVILLLILIYFGAPTLKSWKNNKTYWDWRQKELELSKLFYESENARINAKIETSKNNLLDELEAQRKKLRPNFNRHSISYKLRIVFSSIGALLALFSITLTHYLNGSMSITTALSAAVLQAVLPALMASTYQAQSRIHSFWFAFGAGLLFHLLTIAVYLVMLKR